LRVRAGAISQGAKCAVVVQLTAALLAVAFSMSGAGETGCTVGVETEPVPRSLMRCTTKASVGCVKKFHAAHLVIRWIADLLFTVGGPIRAGRSAPSPAAGQAYSAHRRLLLSDIL
jgi:hypothetical protein